MPPDVVLFLFLPALLYWEAITISVREMRSNLRAIALTSTLLVLATAAAVAAVAHLLGLSWSMAFVLGAVLAPTDATAVSTMARLLPRRAQTVLRAESLINDGTALVLYAVAVAVGVAVGELDVGPGGIAWRLLASYAGGLVVGLLIAIAVVTVRRRMTDNRLDNILSVLTPFLAYLPAELLHVSGVVAVVTCGLTLTRLSPRLGSAWTRVQATGFWTLTTFLLNGSLFVLIGLELHAVVEGLDAATIWKGLTAAGLIALTVAATRLVWTTATIYLIRVLDRRPSQRLRRTGIRARLPTQWAGFRGAVSLAAAIAVPATSVRGTPLDGRDTVLLVTFGVIVLLLVVQGLTLPAVIRFSQVGHDQAEDREQALAEATAAAAAVSALPLRAVELDTPETVRTKVQNFYETIQKQQQVEELLSTGQVLAVTDRVVSDQLLVEADAERVLLLALLNDKREAVVRLHEEQKIDDQVTRRLQAVFDSEELRLTGVEPDEYA